MSSVPERSGDAAVDDAPQRPDRAGTRGGVSGRGGRGWLAAACGAGLVLALAGCAKPAGVDGDLTNAWPAFPKATTPTPAVSACYVEEYDATWYGPFDSVPCSQAHQTETAYVGAFTGAVADAAVPPDASSAGRKAAYQNCVAEAADYLGGDWHLAYVWLGMVLPSPAAWTGGARWYRCDLLKTGDVEHGTVRNTGTVRDGLRGNRPLAITCINTAESNDKVESEAPADCAKPHSGELAGVTSGPNIPWPGDSAVQKLADSACEAMVARYLGLSGVHDTNPLVGWLFFWPRQIQWDAGDRSFSCFAYAFTKSKKMTGTVKGLGANAPKG